MSILVIVDLFSSFSDQWLMMSFLIDWFTLKSIFHFVVFVLMVRTDVI